MWGVEGGVLKKFRIEQIVDSSNPMNGHVCSWDKRTNELARAHARTHSRTPFFELISFLSLVWGFVKEFFFRFGYFFFFFFLWQWGVRSISKLMGNIRWCPTGFQIVFLHLGAFFFPFFFFFSFPLSIL